MNIIIVCPVCNKTYITDFLKRKYCSRACYYIAHKENNLDSSTPKISGKFISAIQQANELTNGFFLSPKVYEKIRKKYQLPCYSMIIAKFHKWENALAAANIDPQPNVNNRPLESQSVTKNTIPPTVDAIIADILRVRDIVQQTPTLIQYKQHGLFEWNLASFVLTGKRGAWAETCLACNLQPHTRSEGSGNGTISQYTTQSGINVNMQSSYEVRFANRLTYWNEKWLCHQELPDGIPFAGYNQKPAIYRPDFFIPSRNLYFDTKGWYRPRDQGKMKLIHGQHPDLKVYLVFKEQLALAEHVTSFDEWFTACSFVQF
jgi:hypothetical protein